MKTQDYKLYINEPSEVGNAQGVGVGVVLHDVDPEKIFKFTAYVSSNALCRFFCETDTTLDNLSYPMVGSIHSVIFCKENENVEVCGYFKPSLNNAPDPLHALTTFKPEYEARVRLVLDRLVQMPSVGEDTVIFVKITLEEAE